MKIKAVLGLAVVAMALVLSGCGEPRVDASTPQSLDDSSNAIISKASDSDKEAMQLSYSINSLRTGARITVMDRRVPLEERSEVIHSIMKRAVHNKTAKEINNFAEKHMSADELRILQRSR